MRKLMWLLTGVGLGFVAAHFVNQTPEGRRFFDRLNQGAREFSDAVASGYHDVELAADEAIDEADAVLESALEDIQATRS